MIAPILTVIAAWTVISVVAAFILGDVLSDVKAKEHDNAE